MIMDSNTCLCIRILKQIHVLRNSLVNKRFISIQIFDIFI